MTDDSGDLNEVRRRLREIQATRRGKIRWSITRHTAELALGALAGDVPDAAPRRGKTRRRKRYKRLL